MTCKKGYTLIEILIVLALFSVLLSLAMPHMNFYKDMVERQEISEFRKDLLYARNKAIIENKRYYVFFNQDKNTYSIKLKEDSPSIKDKTFSMGLKLDNEDVLGSFCFGPSGAAIDSGTVRIKSSRDRWYIVSLTPATSRIEIRVE